MLGGRDVVVMLNGAAAMSKLRLLLAVRPSRSVAMKVTEETPAAVGVPVISPVAETPNPAGSRPWAVQLTGGTPPAALRVVGV